MAKIQYSVLIDSIIPVYLTAFAAFNKDDNISDLYLTEFDFYQLLLIDNCISNSYQKDIKSSLNKVVNLIDKNNNSVNIKDGEFKLTDKILDSTEKIAFGVYLQIENLDSLHQNALNKINSYSNTNIPKDQLQMVIKSSGIRKDELDKYYELEEYKYYYRELSHMIIYDLINNKLISDKYVNDYYRVLIDPRN